MLFRLNAVKYNLLILLGFAMLGPYSVAFTTASQEARIKAGPES